MLSFTIPIAKSQGLRALWRSFGNTLLTVGLPNTPYLSSSRLADRQFN